MEEADKCGICFKLCDHTEGDVFHPIGHPKGDFYPVRLCDVCCKIKCDQKQAWVNENERKKVN